MIANQYKIKVFQYKSGITGEEIVLRELLRLPDEYMIFRNIHLPHILWDIDFTVIGPSGIYIIEVKKVRGEIEFDGKELLCSGKLLEGKSVISQVQSQYWGLHNYLKTTTNESVFISTIIVFVNSSLKHSFGFDPVKEYIRVMDYRDIYTFLSSLPSRDNSNQYAKVGKQLEIVAATF
jgi:hypothetical protein